MSRVVELGERIPLKMIEIIFFFLKQNLRQVIILVPFNSIPFPISSYYTLS